MYVDGSNPRKKEWVGGSDSLMLFVCGINGRKGDDARRKDTAEHCRTFALNILSIITLKRQTHNICHMSDQ